MAFHAIMLQRDAKIASAGEELSHGKSNPETSEISKLQNDTKPNCPNFAIRTNEKDKLNQAFPRFASFECPIIARGINKIKIIPGELFGLYFTSLFATTKIAVVSNNNIFSAISMHAMKMFSHCFPDTITDFNVTINTLIDTITLLHLSAIFSFFSINTELGVNC